MGWDVGDVRVGVKYHRSNATVNFAYSHPPSHIIGNKFVYPCFLKFQGTRGILIHTSFGRGPNALYFPARFRSPTVAEKGNAPQVVHLPSKMSGAAFYLAGFRGWLYENPPGKGPKDPRPLSKMSGVATR